SGCATPACRWARWLRGWASTTPAASARRSAGTPAPPRCAGAGTIRWAESGADLGEPVGQVVVVGDARHPALTDLEEGARRQAVGLAVGLRQPLVGGPIFPQHDKLCGSVAPVAAGHDDHILQPFLVTTVHARHEGCKGVAAGFALALVDIVDHV